ncbi:hypothetical protein [Ralstonia phage RSP15]|uniref:hypothetical protein n=1 Tax=Ralstonia phage RSP15 TaxID=1785960 RepID=UPI00074D4913|nr:hypothetical protein BH754_gp012 [Ralstonia phage RSP15]BAU39970.1 hypothetical protein [Ralstonia phage RSP15]
MGIDMIDTKELKDALYFCGNEIDKKNIEALIDRYAARAESATYGRNRIVFLMKGYVVKIAKNYDGECDNEWEGSVSNSEESYNNPEYVQYPRTRLACFNGAYVLFMERVREASGEEIRKHLGTPKGGSDWTWSVDCGQVGFTKSGRLVAYDYGYH